MSIRISFALNESTKNEKTIRLPHVINAGTVGTQKAARASKVISIILSAGGSLCIKVFPARKEKKVLVFSSLISLPLMTAILNP